MIRNCTQITLAILLLTLSIACQSKQVSRGSDSEKLQKQKETAQTKLSIPDTHYFVYGYKVPDHDKWSDLFKTATVFEGRTEDAEFVKKLRSEGKVFAYRRHLNMNQFDPEKSVVEFLEEPFNNTLDGKLPGGFDAIAIDEVGMGMADGVPRGKRLMIALKELRAKYPTKGIYVACAHIAKNLTTKMGKPRFTEFFNTIIENNLILNVELYHRESKPRTNEFVEIAEELEKLHPGILKQSIYIVGIKQKGKNSMDDVEKIDFLDHLRGQLMAVKNCEVCKQMPGVGYWTFYRAKPELQQQLAPLLAEFSTP